MDILDFSEEIKNFRHNGTTLNLDERMQIEMGLNTLQASKEIEELVFWGKIEGIKQDYFIAMGLTFRNMYEFPVKTFFWALGGEFIFREMPDLTEQHDALIDEDTSYFQGTPNQIVAKSKEDGEGEEGQEENKSAAGSEENGQAQAAKNSDDSSEEEVKVPTRPLTELDRLTTVVHAIENDCQICPVGAFKMTPEHQVRRNEAFRGLNSEDGMRLENYLHFRNVQDAAKRADLDLPTAPFNE